MPNKEQFKTHKEYLEWYSIYRERNAEKLREYNRRYNKAWRRDFGYETEKRYKEKYPEKWKAQKLAHYAVRIGKIKRQNCENCGSVKSQMHHPSYKHPLTVVWLCALCHKQLHREIKNRSRKLST